MRGDIPEYSDETLLGYLLQGLPEDESRAIEDAIGRSDVLRQRVEDLRCMLDPMQAMDESYEPRADLIANTMERVAEQAERLRDPSLGTAATRLSDLSRLEWADTPSYVRIAWLDSLVTIAAGIVFLTFLLPTVWQWRETARRIACSENLRILGQSIWSFGDLSGTHEIPKVELNGPDSFAGVYAFRLRDHALLQSPSVLLCPSSPTISLISFLPSTSEFLAASPERQKFFRSSAADIYAFNAGNMIGRKYRTPKLDCGFSFAVLGDRWLSDSAFFGDNDSEIDLHGNRLTNILFNDGNVRLVRLPHSREVDANCPQDHPYINLFGRPFVGVGARDCCLLTGNHTAMVEPNCE